MSIVHVLAAIGAVHVVGYLVLAVVAFWGANRGDAIQWNPLYAQAHGVGFGFWRVRVTRDVGDVRTVVLPSRWLAGRYVSRYAGEKLDIIERGRAQRESLSAEHCDA